jgi:hypothetical protein
MISRSDWHNSTDLYSKTLSKVPFSDGKKVVSKKFGTNFWALNSAEVWPKNTLDKMKAG